MLAHIGVHQQGLVEVSIDLLSSKVVCEKRSSELFPIVVPSFGNTLSIINSSSIGNHNFGYTLKKLAIVNSPS